MKTFFLSLVYCVVVFLILAAPLSAIPMMEGRLEAREENKKAVSRGAEESQSSLQTRSGSSYLVQDGLSLVFPDVPTHQIDPPSRENEGVAMQEVTYPVSGEKMPVPSPMRVLVTHQDEEDYGDTITYNPRNRCSQNLLKMPPSATSTIVTKRDSSLDVLEMQEDSPSQHQVIYPPIPNLQYATEEALATAAADRGSLPIEGSAPPIPDTMYFVPDANQVIDAPHGGDIISGYRQQAKSCFEKAEKENAPTVKVAWHHGGEAFEKAAKYLEAGEREASEFCIQAATCYARCYENQAVPLTQVQEIVYQNMGSAYFFMGRVKRYAAIDPQAAEEQLQLLASAIKDYQKVADFRAPHFDPNPDLIADEKNKKLCSLYEKRGVSRYQAVAAKRYLEHQNFSPSHGKEYYHQAEENYKRAIGHFSKAIEFYDTNSDLSKTCEDFGMSCYERGDSIMALGNEELQQGSTGQSSNSCIIQ